MYSGHQSLFYAWHLSTAAIITLKGVLSSSLILRVLSIPHFPQPPPCRTTCSVYCLMGPSGMLMDFSTAQSFYFINTVLSLPWLVLCCACQLPLCLESPKPGPNWRPLFNACPVFCHFVQFVSLWGSTFAPSSVSSIPSVAWHKVYHMMYWPPALLLSLCALIILY